MYKQSTDPHSDRTWSDLLSDTHASDSCSACHGKNKGREKEKTYQYTPHHAQYKPPPSEIFLTVGYTTSHASSTHHYQYFYAVTILSTWNIHSWWLQLGFFFFFFSNVEENHRWCYFRQTFTFPVMDSLKNCNALLQKWISYYTLANASSFVSRME